MLRLIKVVVTDHFTAPPNGGSFYPWDVVSWYPGNGAQLPTLVACSMEYSRRALGLKINNGMIDLPNNHKNDTAD